MFPLRLDWLSDACPDRQGGEVLGSVLFEARQAAGFSQRMLTRYWDTIQTDKRIIHLAANGHTSASIAERFEIDPGNVTKIAQHETWKHVASYP